MQKQPVGDKTVQERAAALKEFYLYEVLGMLYEMQLKTIQNECDSQLYQA